MATRPRTSSGENQAWALLKASIVAVNSESRSGVSGNPAVKSTRLLRPATEARFLARIRIESRTLYAPKLFSAELSEGPLNPGAVSIAVGDAGLVAMEELLMPATTCFSLAASVVKF